MIGARLVSAMSVQWIVTAPGKESERTMMVGYCRPGAVTKSIPLGQYRWPVSDDACARYGANSATPVRNPLGNYRAVDGLQQSS